MKAKDIIFIQNAIRSAVDFVHSNTDADETGIGEEMMDELNESHKLLQKEKERIYLNNELKKLRKKKK